MKWYYSFFILILFSCTTKQASLPVLDFAKAMRNPEDIDLFSYASEISFVPLETSEDCLLQLYVVRKMGEHFYIQSGNPWDANMYKFSLSGKYEGQIGKQGRAPGEYILIQNYSVTEDDSCIYFMDNNKVVKYSCNDGSFIRQYTGADDWYLSCNQVTAAFGYLFFRNDERAMDGVTLRVCDNDFNVIKSFDRKSMRDHSARYRKGIGFDGDYVYYEENLCDTLFGIDKNLNIQPMAILDLGPEGATPECYDKKRFPHWIITGADGFCFYSKNVWVICVEIVKGFPGPIEIKIFIYLKSLDRLVCPQKYHVEYNHIIWRIAGAFQDELILEAKPTQLIENKDKITNPELLKIVEELDENSNPVLAVLKFKDEKQ